jgi:hypothetical protein
MLVYCFVKSFLNTPVIPTLLAVWIFSLCVETSQYFHIADKFGLGESPVARTVMGTSFEWSDIIAYTIGITALLSRKNNCKKRLSRNSYF